jgi:hypothetical protein
VHDPASEQPSPVDPHVEQDTPAGAHCVEEVVVQRVPSQHPAGHDVALHTHVAPEQICPTPHAVCPPHVHVPPAEQPSAFVPQVVHVPPPAPHSLVEGDVTHTEPLQQPLGQVVPLQLAQLPPLQNGSDPVQELHAPPPAPQYVLVFPPSHWLPLQHPPLHEDASQTHAPPMQCCPVVQGDPVPQVHWPVVAEQLSEERPHAVQFNP